MACQKGCTSCRVNGEGKCDPVGCSSRTFYFKTTKMCGGNKHSNR